MVAQACKYVFEWASQHAYVKARHWPRATDQQFGQRGWHRKQPPAGNVELLRGREVRTYRCSWTEGIYARAHARDRELLQPQSTSDKSDAHTRKDSQGRYGRLWMAVDNPACRARNSELSGSDSPTPIMEGLGPETRKPATDGRASCPAKPGKIRLAP